MKIRCGFVSNSSSSSFIVNKTDGGELHPMFNFLVENLETRKENAGYIIEQNEEHIFIYETIKNAISNTLCLEDGMYEWDSFLIQVGYEGKRTKEGKELGITL